MTLNQELDKSEIKKAAYFFVLQSKRIRKIGRYLIPFAIFVGVMSYQIGFPLEGLGFLWPILILPSSMVLIIVLTIWGAYTLAKRQQKYIKFNFDSWGMTATTNGGEEEKIAWLDFDYWKEFNGMIFLYHSENEYKLFIISAKAFKTTIEKGEFVKILGDNRVKRK